MDVILQDIDKTGFREIHMYRWYAIYPATWQNVTCVLISFIRSLQHKEMNPMACIALDGDVEREVERAIM